jgi:hypothetical protein
MILLIPFVEGTDPIMICSDPMIKFFCGSVSSLVTDLADTLTKQKKLRILIFFMDPSRWIYYFDVVAFSDLRLCINLSRAGPDADACHFLCGVTIGVPDPDWIFYASFRSETPVLNPRVVGLFIWRRDPRLFAGFSKHCVSSFRIRIFFYNNRASRFY